MISVLNCVDEYVTYYLSTATHDAPTALDCRMTRLLFHSHQQYNTILVSQIRISIDFYTIENLNSHHLKLKSVLLIRDSICSWLFLSYVIFNWRDWFESWADDWRRRTVILNWCDWKSSRWRRLERREQKIWERRNKRVYTVFIIV